jgi:hypothetical protein
MKVDGVQAPAVVHVRAAAEYAEYNEGFA